MTFMPPEWGCLPSSVSKRLDYLLSSLSLCLRFATLTQFPPTSDFRCFVFACQGSIASLAAIFAPSVDGDYTAPEQDSRAAADDRSRGKSYSSFNAATPRYGQCNRQAPHLFELLARNGKRLSFGRATPVFFLGKENGGRITRHLCRIDIRTCAKKEEFSFEKENIPLSRIPCTVQGKNSSPLKGYHLLPVNKKSAPRFSKTARNIRFANSSPHA